MITLEDVVARTDDAVVHASAYWLTMANALLKQAAAASPLTPEERSRWRLIQAEMRRREMTP